jgi:hypothetical protein
MFQLVQLHFPPHSPCTIISFEDTTQFWLFHKAGNASIVAKMVDGTVSVVGLARLAYSTAAKAWTTVGDAISFPEDSEDLLIRIETSRARFDIWGSLSGLEHGPLRHSLVPFESLIERALRRIDQLFSNADQLSDRYGLALEDVSKNNVEKQKSRIARMQRSLRAANARLRHPGEKQAPEDQLVHLSLDPGPAKRLQWAIKDRAMFEGFIGLVEVHVDGLQKLLSESQRRTSQQEVTRFAFQVVGSSSDTQSLSTLKTTDTTIHRRFDEISAQNLLFLHAELAELDDPQRQYDEQNPPQEGSEIDMRLLAQLKIISCQPGSATIEMVRPEHFNLQDVPLVDRKKGRFLHRAAFSKDVCYLLEKKEYDGNITEQDKVILEKRVQRLVSLLSAPHAARELHTLQAVGYADDPELHSWWLAFRFPLPAIVPISLSLTQKQPLSLRKIYNLPFKPPLEKRYQLATKVAHTLAKLYGSDWMHKSISSDNIIFPQVYDENQSVSFRAISSALVQGFGYSRQHTEAQTIDQGKVLGDLESAIYRHPNYQGVAASGYKIQYDIYSFGLVLFEIALWTPMISMLAAVPRHGGNAVVHLSPDMKHFHQFEALELKRRVMLRVDSELAFRLGTRYCEVVRWCLGFSRSEFNDDQPWQAGVEFYNNVVIPLEEISNE